ncbi:MAG: hypothetical protein U5K73_08425 [Halofilum sp. (in: g-proteobacteria)]|nr:hypothetical protein [Halofilum sp. (in: g-proteobacteria)]
MRRAIPIERVRAYVEREQTRITPEYERERARAREEIEAVCTAYGTTDPLSDELACLAEALSVETRKL